MKKFYLILVAVCATLLANAATEPAWYNDVTSITANGQYYIYSVGGTGFMKAGSATVMAATTSATPSLFTITKADKGNVSSGGKYLKSYMKQGGSGSGSGPLSSNTSDDGTTIIWTSMNSGEYWNIHGSYYAWFGDRYACLKYESGAYEGFIKGSGVNYSTTKDTQTDSKFRWYLVSQAQYGRHFAIYAFDSYKESVSNYTEFENEVPTAYYNALDEAYKKTFDVTNAAHSKDVVEAAHNNLKTLYDNVPDIKVAYEAANQKILEMIGLSKYAGEDYSALSDDVQTANQKVSASMSVADLNASVAHFRALDPVHFIAKDSFDIFAVIDTIAYSEQGQTIHYSSNNQNIVNADMKAIYGGDVTITVTTDGNDQYYPFKTSKTITIVPLVTYGEKYLRNCLGSSVEYEGNSYPVGWDQSYAVTLKNRNYTGGDSIVTLWALPYPTFNVTDGATICESELPYTWEGITFTQAGTETKTLQTIHGCDSTVTFTLTVYPEYNVEDGDTICANELSTYTWQGLSFTESLVQTTTLTSAVGCDSTVTFTLVVNPTYNEKDSATVCPAALPYTWEDKVFTEAGTQTTTLTSVNGCDSVVTFTLKVNEAYEVTDGATICPTELPYTWESETFTEAGTKTLTLTSAVGCDSIVTFTLNVLPTYTVEEKDTMYVGKPNEWHNIDLSKMAVGDTTLVDSLQTVAGCDSVILLQLHVDALPTTYGNLEFSYCKGEELEFEGQKYPAGEYTITIPNYLGGDSIITITITELPTYTVEKKDTVTYGDPYQYGTQKLTPDAGDYTYTDSLKTAQGCDSVIVTKLTVLKSPQTISWDLPTCYCVFMVGDSVELTAVATSGWDVSFAIDNEELATLKNYELILLKPGDLKITAYQEGDANFLPAEPIEFIMNIQQQPEEAIDQVQTTNDQRLTTKVVINGQLYILRDNVLYDLTGKKVK